MPRIRRFNFLAALAFLILALSGLPTAAAAPAPASEASLKQLFEVQRARGMVDETLSLLEAQHVAQVLRESSPEKLEAAQRGHERVAALLRQRVTWATLEPLLLEVYQQHYTEPEIQDLLAYYETEAGCLSIDKLQPLALRAQISAVEATEQRLGSLIEDILKDRPVKRLPRSRWKPSSPQEQLAADLSAVLMKDSFAAQLKALEQQVGEHIRMLLPEQDARRLAPRIKRMLAAVRANLAFGDIQPVIVKELAAGLSETELQLLLADARLAERKAQREKQRIVHTAASAAVNGWMMTNLMPELMQVVFSEERAASEAK